MFIFSLIVLIGWIWWENSSLPRKIFETKHKEELAEIREFWEKHPIVKKD